MIVIDTYLKQLESKLEVPYPERRDLLLEMRSNYLFYFEELQKKGLSRGEASRQALQSVQIDRSSEKALHSIYLSRLYLLYRNFSVPLKEALEAFVGLIPLIASVHYLKQEVPMMDLIKQGGLAMYPIIAIGGLAILLQLKIIFSWFVARNHSESSLRSDQKLPLILGAGCFILGFLGTLLGLYKTFHYVVQMEDKTKLSEIMAWGVSESIINIIFATAVLLIIFSLHFLIKYTARAQHIPV